ncbi:MAG: hypothetical protein HYV07_23450 [Deltaproteobacteria bacterium]|nr:hypothetical protein [Deltaproteobacteria bacterium]
MKRRDLGSLGVWLALSMIAFAACATTTTRVEESGTVAPSREIVTKSGEWEFEERAKACLARANPAGLSPARATFFLLSNMRGQLPAALVFEGFQREPESESTAESAIERGMVDCLHRAGAFLVEGPAGMPHVTRATAELARGSLAAPAIRGWVQGSSTVRVVETWIPWSLGRIEVANDDLSDAIGDFTCGPPVPETQQDDDVYLLVEVGGGRARVVADAGLAQVGNPSTGEWHWLGSDRGFTVLTRCLSAKLGDWKPAPDQWGLVLVRARLDVPGTKPEEDQGSPIIESP